MTLTKAYEELVDFIAAGSSPQSVSEFHPSEAAKARVLELIARAKSETLTVKEASELEHYQQLEHIMRLAKARARLYVTDSQIT
ncbi:MAG TPA: hypothetical protein VKU00_34110 [Chthonomonadaceae bacterium]|nr:hypothetical protein [Chthonomonadaceae bacterium]